MVCPNSSEYQRAILTLSRSSINFRSCNKTMKLILIVSKTGIRLICHSPNQPSKYFCTETTEQKLRKTTSSSDLRYGSVWIDKLFEMINQEFKAQGTKYQVLTNFGFCCRELAGFKVTSFRTCKRSFCSVHRNMNC